MSADRDEEAFVPDEPYVSPALSRVRHARLTADDLKRDAPLYQEGRRAELLLASPDAAKLSGSQRNALRRKVEVGKAAQERLVTAAIPLVKHMAAKEQRRRSGWASAVGFDELFQEGMIGFLRGLMAYDPNTESKAPTHYLGQWANTEMRRNLEQMENDFGVPYETAERFRRIRAIRARLASDLGREPTEQEMIDASVESAPRGGIVLGRLGSVGKAGKAITPAQLAEEKAYRTRVGTLARPGDREDEDDPFISDEVATPVTGEDQGDASTSVVAGGSRVLLARLFEETLLLMGAAEVQKRIVSMRFGLYPLEVESTPRQISTHLNVERSVVEDVLEAFTAEMSRVGGFFHQATAAMDPDDLADLGLGWVEATLGNYADLPSTKQRKRADRALTKPLDDETVIRDHQPPVQVPTQPGVYAQFVCDFHDRAFIGLYRSRRAIPKTRDCPSCGRPSPLQYVLEQK